MTVHLYVLPIVHLIDPLYDVPKYLPHRFNSPLVGLENLFWALVPYQLEDVALLIADVTDAQHTLLSAQTDVIAVPPLDNTIQNATVRNRVRTVLEAANVPAGWVNVGMTYRSVVRTVISLFAYHRPVVRRLGRRLFDGTVNLDLTVSQLPSNARDFLQASADELGLDYTGVTGATTLRDLLKLMADQAGGLLDPSFFRIGSPETGLLLNI